MGFAGRSQVVYWGRFIRVLRETAGIANSTVTNRAFIAPIAVPRKMLIDKILFPTPTVSGNAIAGVYADNGLTPVGGSLILSASSLPVATVTTFTVNQVLTQGLYWVVIMFDNAAATFVRGVGISPLADPLNGCRYNATSFNLIDPCPAVTADNTKSPHAHFRVKTVVE